jgi:hypothetical protein
LWKYLDVNQGIFVLLSLLFLSKYFNIRLISLSIITTQNNKNKIKKLIRIYLKLGNGILIHKHEELICVSHMYNIYISRRSLRHFVERRKAELIIRYNYKDILERLYFAIDCIEDVFSQKDSFEINDLGRMIYTKNYNNLDRSSIRIVVESKEDRLEIVSIHFKKNKKLP